MVTWDERKRQANLRNHGLDFDGCEAGEIASAIAAAPERVHDPDSPYDPNDAEAVEAFWKNATVRRPGQRGPGKKARKVLLSVRYSPEVVEYFKSTGEGWQTRMDDALKEWLASHRSER